MTTPEKSSRFKEAVSWLFARTNYENFKSVPYRRYRENLDRLRDFLDTIGSPDRKMTVVHVAGTKGKGSVSMILEALLRHAGYRTGLFTSPHLFSILERFEIDGVPCDEDFFADVFFDLRDRWEEYSKNRPEESLTFFEWSVVLAFEIFARRGVQIVLLETGLGGRFDATNVCLPDVCVITSISYDHMDQLGSTLPEILGEKCGIIKRGIPVVSGIGSSCLTTRANTATLRTACPPITSNDVARLRGIIKTHAEMAQAPLVQVMEISDMVQNIAMAVPGSLWKWNAQLAMEVLTLLRQKRFVVPPETVEQVLSELKLPGRFQQVHTNPVIIVDGAHNRASAAALIQELNERYPKRVKTLVFGVSHGKDVEGMFLEFLSYFDEYLWSQATNTPRAIEPEELEKRFQKFLRDLPDEMKPTRGIRTRVLSDCHELESIIAEREGQQDSHDRVYCVTGSFYLAAMIAELFRDSSSSERV